MNINTLTIKAQELLQEAMTLARERKQQSVEPLHIAVAATKEDGSLASYLLARVGCNMASLRAELNDLLGMSAQRQLRMGLLMP